MESNELGLISEQATPDSARPWLKYYDPDVPAHLTYPRIPIHQLLEDSAARFPERPCVYFMGRAFSYQHINDQADRLAAGLRERGLQAGDRVALLLPNAPQYLIAYYGALKAGAVVVPLNPLYTAHELAVQLADSEAQTIITLPLFLEKIAPLRESIPLKRFIFSRLADFLPFPLNVVQAFREKRLLSPFQTAGLIDFMDVIRAAQRETFKPEPIDPDTLAVLIYSGGTTGVAKGIMLSHFNCVANAMQAVAWGRLDREGRLLAVLPLFHGFGMSVTMNAPVLSGGEIVLLPRFNARQVVQAIQKYKTTFFIGVPTMFVALSSLPDIGRYDLSSLQGVFVGAAPLTRAIKDNFERITSAQMIEGYGLTEAVTAVMANPFRGLHKLGSIGVPFPDMDMRIIGLEDGKPLPPGELGEIALRGPTVMLGYYKNPDETARVLVDGWLHTGDIGYMDEDGYFYITDRKKDLIIVGGFNVFPREIDEILYQHPKIKEGISVGIPDPYKGERIKVFAVLKDGETATPEELISYFKTRLTGYKVPSEVEFRDDLPKNMIGKILRRALREETINKATP